MSTRSRTAAAVLSALLAGPFLLAGCGEDAGSEAAATSAATTQGASKDGATESTAPDGAADGGADTADLPADTEADTEADTADASADAAVTVSDVRVGAHDGFDRVVLEVGGSGTPGWDVRYVDAATSQGSGDAVDVAGDAVLQVTLTGVGYPYETGVEEAARGAIRGTGSSAVTEAVFDTTFEGTSVTFVGTSAQLPFRVYALSDPTRVVVEVAHGG